MKKTFVIIANGGELKTPEVKKLIVTDTDEEFVGNAAFNNFEEYCEYVKDDTCAEYEQDFARAVVMTIEQYIAMPILMD